MGYEQMMRGRWFTANGIDYKNKILQRRICKMMENMMMQMDKNKNKNDEHCMDLIDIGGFTNYIDPYIQSLFESVTKHLPKRTIWLSKECKLLLPELQSILINDFVPFLKQTFGIKSKYAHVQNWAVSIKHLRMTQRQNPLKSAPFDHLHIFSSKVNAQKKIEENAVLSLEEFEQMKQPKDVLIRFGFRCYKKKNMFKGEFVCNELPQKIECVKVLGGLYFPQIDFIKWDWCTFSSKLSKGSSLFALSRICESEQD